MSKFDIKLMIWLIPSFILSVIIGTVSHEYAHYTAAHLLGYKAQIHHASTTWQKAESNPLNEENENFIIIIAGIAQTIFTGTVGLWLLYYNRISYYQTKVLDFKQWFIIFITLFWLRQTINCIIMIGKYLVNGDFSRSSDEYRIEQILHLPTNVLSFSTALIGFAILLYIITFIPVRQRFPFIFSGIIGGIGGYILWIHGIGHWIIP